MTINTALTNSGQLYNNALLSNSSGATLTNAGGLENHDRLLNYGALNNTGFLTNAAGATLTNVGALTNASSAQFVNKGKLFNLAGASLVNNSAGYGFAGGLINRGVLYNSGILANPSGSRIDIEGTLENLPGGTFTNAGRVFFPNTVSTPSAVYNRGVLINSGLLGVARIVRNASGASFDNTGEVTAIRLYNHGALTNSGTVRPFSGGGIGSHLRNYGSLTNQVSGSMTGGLLTSYSGGLLNNDGMFQFSVIDIQGGTISGTGTWQAFNEPMKVGAGATASPGNSPGTMTVDSNLDFAGLLDIELASATSWDELHVTGLLKFISGYHIDFSLGFGLTGASYSFDFVHADGGLSNFDPFAFNIFGDYAGYLAQLLATCDTSGMQCDVDLRFTRQGDGSVPEPGTLLLCALGLGAFTWARRKRQTPAAGGV